MPHEIEIVYGLWGKPAFINERNINFNLSHSNDHILYALLKNYEIGIDLEYVDDSLLKDDDLIYALSKEESNFLLTLSPENKIDYFFKFWVCKESFLKATGKGFLENYINQQSTYLFKKKCRTYLNGKITYPYYFIPISGYAAALFVQGPPLKPLYYLSTNHNQPGLSGP